MGNMDATKGTPIITTIQYRVVHTTEYCFEKPVSDFKVVAHLRPLESKRQHCDFFQLACRPPFQFQENGVDTFGNHVSVVNIDIELQRLILSAISTVSVTVSPWLVMPDKVSTAFQRYIQPTELTAINEEVTSFAHKIFPSGIKPSEAASILGRYIHTNLRYSHGVSDVHTGATDVLRQRSGVCQDFTHLAIAALRAAGMPARYISGYLYTAAFQKGVHRIASDVSHAWFEVYDPEAGWIGFDSTNGCQVDEKYISVARGRDYNDICPLQGRYGEGASHTMRVSVDVQQIS